MDLKNRLEILLTAEMITKDSYNSLINLIEEFKNKFNVVLTEDNGTMFITHMTAVLGRVEKNEQLVVFEDFMKVEIENNDKYQEARELLDTTLNICNITITEAEQMFILMHLCTLLS